MSVLMVHSLQQITDVPDPRRERNFSVEQCSLPKMPFFSLPDLKPHKINSLGTFSNNFCGLRVKTKTVPLRSFLTCTENPWLTPVWAVEFHSVQHLCGCLPPLVSNRSPTHAFWAGVTQWAGIHLPLWVNRYSKCLLPALVTKSKLAMD